MRAPTQRQMQIFEFVVECLAGGEPPTSDEIAAEFGFSRQAADGHVRALIEKGYLRRARSHRSISVTDFGWRCAQAAEERHAGRRAGVGPSLARTVVTLRLATRRASPEQRQMMLEFACA